MINFIKGILVGIFNIAPGLSGSALLIVLGLYEDCLKTISNIFNNPKKSVLFLTPITLGIILGTFLCSNVIYYFLNSYYKSTYIVFMFLLLATVPSLIKESIKKGFNIKYLIPFVISFSIGILFLFINVKNTKFIIDYSFISIIKYIFIGSILSISTVIPGISSTASLSMLGLYNTYIYAISHIIFLILIPTGVSFLITSFFLAKIINYLIDSYYGYTYFFILGFATSSLPFMLKIGMHSFNIINLSIGIVFFIITYLFFKVIK